MPQELPTVGEYLAKRLKEIAISNIFGVVGDYVLGVCRAYGKLTVNYAKFPLFRIDWEKVHQQQIYRN